MNTGKKITSFAEMEASLMELDALVLIAQEVTNNDLTYEDMASLGLLDLSKWYDQVGTLDRDVLTGKKQVGWEELATKLMAVLLESESHDKKSALLVIEGVRSDADMLSLIEDHWTVVVTGPRMDPFDEAQAEVFNFIVQCGEKGMNIDAATKQCVLCAERMPLAIDEQGLAYNRLLRKSFSMLRDKLSHIMEMAYTRSLIDGTVTEHNDPVAETIQSAARIAASSAIDKLLEGELEETLRERLNNIKR